MPTIAATATAVPEYRFSQDEARALARRMPVEPRRMATVQAVFENAGVRHRYSVRPLDWVMTPRPLGETSREYREHAVRLGSRVALECLERAGVAPSDVDMLIAVSCTGLMIPSLDAHLINELGFRPDVCRLPINGLGCAGGAAGLQRAFDFVRAHPGSKALVVAVELSSLTFQQSDGSMANMVSSALFGDGATAALVTGEPAPGAEILDTASFLFPDSYDAMGFDLRETGLHIVLSKEVSSLIGSQLPCITEPFLRRNGLTRQDLSFFVLHPGGRRILEVMEEALAIPREQVQPSWNVLAEYGNLSSATVLFVLHEWLTTRARPAGQHGVMGAFGPGFSAEMLLLRWT